MNRVDKFTLIEMLIVIAIIGILCSILLPSLSRAKERARLAVCLSNNRQLNVMSQVYSKDNKYVLPSQTWRSKDIKSKYWMKQINPDWKEMSDIDVRDTAFECTTFKYNKKKYLSPGVSEERQISIGGIGYNRYIGGDVEKRYGKDAYNYTFTMLQVARPSETVLFADTRNDPAGSGGPDWLQQAINWAHNNVEVFTMRHQVSSGLNGWRIPLSWVDGSANIMRSVDYHSREQYLTLINAIR